MGACVLPQAGGCIGGCYGRRHLFALPGWSIPLSLCHPQLQHARLQAERPLSRAAGHQCISRQSQIISAGTELQPAQHMPTMQHGPTEAATLKPSAYTSPSAYQTGDRFGAMPRVLEQRASCYRESVLFQTVVMGFSSGCSTCRARPKEKDSAQCLDCCCSACLLMLSRYTVASSSDKPPDRNMIPGIAGGIHLRGLSDQPVSGTSPWCRTADASIRH